MSTVLRVENLYKEYRLGIIGYGTLYRDLQSWWAKMRKKPDPNSLLGRTNPKLGNDKILALENINLEVKDGEVLGIIGANGAGKSTLLKILSKVTAPTSGTIKYNGRVASLLEVGTGFHTELTGGENIYLNGAINGMNKREVKTKLDEIVDFAGVEKFLDTPVKRYSSGMIVRLGFAVAAYLEPDILAVDEVLAVGDASFRKKATNKMQDVTKSEGRTVLFVSHNMDSIKNLCTRSVLLKDGTIINDGPTEEVINNYLASATDEVKKNAGERTWDIDNAPGNDTVRLLGIRSKNEKGEIISTFDVSEDVFIEVEFIVLKSGMQFYQCLEFNNMSSVGLFRTFDNYINNEWGKQEPLKLGRRKTTYCIPCNFLQEGIISLNVNISSPDFAHNFSSPIREIDIFQINITDTMNIHSARGSYPFNMNGPVLRPRIKSITEYLSK